MARFLFVSLPLSGHLDWGGMLATAAVLVQRGHDVIWTSEPAVQAPVAASRVAFQAISHSGWRPQAPLPPSLPAAERARLRQQRALDSWLHPPTIIQAVAELSALLRQWRPHLVIAEPYAAAAALVAEQTGTPLVVCGRPALPELPVVSSHPAAQRIEQLCEATGVTGRNWDLARAQPRSPLLHLDFFSRRWYADLAEVAPQTRFVGGTARQRAPRSNDQPPVVLITLGTLFRHDPVFFRIAAEAVLLEGGQPLLVTGQRDQEPIPAWLEQLPHGVEVQGWVDYARIMPRLAAIIHHGGVGTTHAALRHGLPQVAVPHAGDQQPQAGRITQAQVGYGVRPADFNPANARWLARQLLANETLRASATAWASDLHALGGVPVAADALQEAFNLNQVMV